MQVSQNFAFLNVHTLQLVRLGSQAEQYFSQDPNTCLIKLRQFGELVAQLVAAKVGLEGIEGESQFELLRRLQLKGAIAGEPLNLFHELRKVGNRATHHHHEDYEAALNGLKYARALGIWFHRAYGNDPRFQPAPFIPPADPDQESDSLRQELEQLRRYVQAQRSTAAAWAASATEEAELRKLAERLLQEAEAKTEAVAAQLRQIHIEAIAKPPRVINQLINNAQKWGQKLDLDERATRHLIDQQLREAGWEVDSETLRYSAGTRPQKGKYRAIAEWPTQSGAVDYALFVGLQIVGVVEAKRQRKDVLGALEQAKRYSRDFSLGDRGEWAGQWGKYRVPFMFATNGREFWEQLRTKSGIWFWDGRRSQNLSRPLRNWYHPQELWALLHQDFDHAQQKLRNQPFNYDFELRPYQKAAIQAVETALAQDQQQLLLAMATGTGKTKTAIALIYRLLKAKRFRRILFLVDRTALGEQSQDAFQETRMEGQQIFADIFEVKSLKDLDIDQDTKVHICTVQAMVKRLLYPAEIAPVFTAGQYDCIIIDECHRGYLLDKEMGEVELSFRDEKDYISKYRQVLTFFDAVKIGLTATPALHTSEIFGPPIYTYSYREAVIDGYLIDHEPPIQIPTELSQEGIQIQAGQGVEIFDPKTGTIDFAHAPDELNFNVTHFNKKIINGNFDRVICNFLATQINPHLPEKTLIFCVRDEHADRIVDCLKLALAERYGEIDNDVVAKITGSIDDPLGMIRHFKNEHNPKIAVTVDLLTTGIDVPKICNLVFLRQVNSRILYEQMIGRATRLCDEIQKEVFKIYDAVNLYENLKDFTTMKPVVVNPNISFGQLFGELETVQDPAAVEIIVEQLFAKLQRKRRHLSPEQTAQIEQLTGLGVGDIVPHLSPRSTPEKVQWLRDKKAIAGLLDRRDGGSNPILISNDPDRLREPSQGYGPNRQRPGDYLDGFSQFLQANLNQVPALLVVTQRPKDLTRQQLKEIKIALDQAGYSEASLRTAWKASKNEDIAASIIGFIRQATLGDALIPYGDRLDRAMKILLASQPWTTPQRKWLERIGKQLQKEYVLDPDSLDEIPVFTNKGGFHTIDKIIFDGQLEGILTKLKDSIWQGLG